MLLRLLGEGWVHRLSGRFGTSAVTAHAVALAVDVEHDAAVEQPVEHGGCDHRIVEDLAPGGNPEVGGEHRRALQVALGDDLKEGRRGLILQW